MSGEAIMNSAKATGSPFRALMWKEWRQQRWLGISLIAVTLLIQIGSVFFVRPSEDDSASILFGVIGGVIGFGALIMGANAFCGEQDDNSQEFLGTLPHPNFKAFLAKSILVIVVTTATVLVAASVFLIQLIAIPRFAAAYPEWREWILPERLALVAGISLGFIIEMTMMPAIVATWVKRTLPCIFLSLFAPSAFMGLGMAGWAYYHELRDQYPSNSMILRYGEFWPPVLVALSLPVLASILCTWSRKERKTRAKIWMAVALVIGLPMAAMGPSICRYSYCTFIAGPSPILPWYGSNVCSPDGKWLPAVLSCPEWGRGTRSAIKNVDTGEVRWMEKWRKSFFMTSIIRNSVWSPSGKKLLMMVDGPLLPFVRDAASPWVVDVATGEGRYLGLPASSRYEQVVPIGWIDDKTVAIAVAGGKSNVAFVDTTSGAITRRKGYPYGQSAIVAGGGVFECEARSNSDEVEVWNDDTDSAHIERHVPTTAHLTVTVTETRPDLDEPLVNTMDLKWTLDEATFRGASAGILAVSPDADWFLIYAAIPNAEYKIESQRQYVWRKGAEAAAMVEAPTVGGGPIGFVYQDQLLQEKYPKGIELINPSDFTRRQIDFPSNANCLSHVIPSPSGRYAVVTAGPITGEGRAKEMAIFVIDFATMSWQQVMKAPYLSREQGYMSPTWLSDERLLVNSAVGDQERTTSTVINRDGTGAHELFKGK